MRKVFMYWKNLLGNAFSTMWTELGVLGLLFGFLFSGVYVLVVGEQVFNWAGILMFAKVLLVLIGVAWVVYVFIVAARNDSTKTKKITAFELQINSTVPNIHPTGLIAARDVNIGHFLPDGSYHLSHIAFIASIALSNRPDSPNRNNNAKGIRAEISCVDESKKVVFTNFQGRWGGLEPNQVIDQRLLESTDFPNNGAVRWLDLVMKYPEDEYCYAYNNDSYGQGYFQNPNHQVESRRFFVQVKLMGEFIPENLFEFEVATKGKGDTFNIRPIGAKWQPQGRSFATKNPPKLKPLKKVTKPKK